MEGDILGTFLGRGLMFGIGAGFWRGDVKLVDHFDVDGVENFAFFSLWDGLVELLLDVDGFAEVVFEFGFLDFGFADVGELFAHFEDVIANV